MGFQVYGLIIVATALSLMALVVRLRRRLIGISLAGWGRIQIGLALFAVSGLAQFLLSIPSLMNIFVPAVIPWLSAVSLVGVALGLLCMLWGLARIVSSARQVQDQRSDDEEWRNLYLQLQELSQQPFSFVEILNLAVKQLLKRAEADGAVVMLFKENTAELVLATFSNLPPDTAKKFELLKVTGDIFGRAQKLGRLQSVANLSDADSSTEELFAGSGFLAATVFPLRAGDKVLGSVGLFSAQPYHFTQKRIAAINVAVNHLAVVLESVRNDKEITRLKERLKPSEEAKKITEELFFRRGIGANLELREAVEFERVRRFFDADCIKLVFRDNDGEYRVRASSGGAETGLLLDKRKLTGISRAVSERKLLLLTSPTSSPAGGGFDSMPRQTLFIPVPYPDRDDLVLLLESETASLQFSEEKLSAVRVASVYLADLHFLFLAKRDGDRYRNSLLQLELNVAKLLRATSRSQLAAALGESCGSILPSCKGRLVILAASGDDDDLFISDSAGLAVASETEWSRYNRFLGTMQRVLLESGEELRTTKSALAERLPADLSDRFHRVLSQLPESVRQFAFPIRLDDSLFGIVGLYFSDEDPASPESVELCRRLVDLAALVLRGSEGRAKQENVPLRAATDGERQSVAGGGSQMQAPALEVPGRGGEPLRLDDPLLKGVETKLEISQMSDANLAELSTMVKGLVQQLFRDRAHEKLFLSSFVDRSHTYYQLTNSEAEMARFREHQVGDRWQPCAAATDMPEVFRSLAGEYHTAVDDNGAASVVWRISRSLDFEEEAQALTILGIDDQEVIRELLSSMVTRMGHRIVTSADGHEGLKLFREGRFDIVILEAGLPGINGWDIAAQVKQMSPLTPVIMLSGWGPPHGDVAALQENVDFVLTKPFRMDQLGQIIIAACGMISS